MADPLTINELIRKITSYTDPTNPITDDEIAYTHIPLAVEELSTRLADLKTIDVGVDPLAATTGDLYDDRILSFLTAAYIDKFFAISRVNPFNNEEIDRNRDVAEDLINNRYAIHIGRGRSMLPSPLDNANPTTGISRTDTTDYD